jgi:hypothetical protein
MANSNVLVFPTKKKISSPDPMIELERFIRGLWTGMPLFATLNLYALEILGLELMLWAAVWRKYTETFFACRGETTPNGPSK